MCLCMNMHVYLCVRACPLCVPRLPRVQSWTLARNSTRHGVRLSNSCGCIRGQMHEEHKGKPRESRDDTETWCGTSDAGSAGLLERWQLADLDTVGPTRFNDMTKTSRDMKDEFDGPQGRFQAEVADSQLASVVTITKTKKNAVCMAFDKMVIAEAFLDSTLRTLPSA